MLFGLAQQRACARRKRFTRRRCGAMPGVLVTFDGAHSRSQRHESGSMAR
jgi:hypothetical protein